MLLAYALLFVPSRLDPNVVFSHPMTGSELKMDVYHPVDSSKKSAAVVVIHGGAWMAGKKEDMAPLCQAIADEGMLAVTIDYRLAPKTTWPGFYDDAQTAVRYLRANAAELNIDPNRIGAAGASAGGEMVLLLGTTDTRDPHPTEYPQFSSRVSAVFDLFGPTDMSRDFPPNLDSMYALVLGKPKSKAQAEVRAASPMNFVDSKSAPTFILHGTADPLVPVIQSHRLEDKLKELNIPVEATYIEGMGHGVNSKTPGVLDAIRRGIAFLKAHL